MTDQSVHLERLGRTSLTTDLTRPLLTVWLSWLILMTGVNLATPLYAVYAQRFDFSTLVLTAVFTTYMLVLIPSLLLFGRLSDQVGRRPVIVAGLLVGCVGLVLFAAAQSTQWLFAARAVQGLGVGMISGAATAALVELDPRRDEQRPALLAGLAQALGSGLGPLLAGILAEWAPAPRHLSFLIMFGATVAAAGYALTLSDPRAASGSWSVQWPRVPPGIRLDFARVSVTGGIVWAAVALCLSIVPSYAADLLSTNNLALLGAIGALALLMSCVTQVVSQRLRLRQRAGQAFGLALLTCGLAALVVASPLHSLALTLTGSAVAGAGHGFGFLNAQDELSAIAPPDERGGVTAAFISCIYFTVAVSVISTGLLDEWLSLSTAVSSVFVVLAVLAIASMAWQLRAGGLTPRARGDKTDG